MKRDNRQILVNPHSSQEKVPVGVLNLGEIGVQHNNVEDAALYVETVADSESAETVAKFITEKAIDSKIENAIDVVQMEINSLNEEIGLPHDPELWNTGMSVWEAIEYTYAEMSAGTAAANTKLNLVGGKDDYLELTHEKDDATSSITYYLSSKNIKEGIESAYTIVNDKVEALSGVVRELSAATEGALDELNFTGVTQEGKPIVNVTQEEGLVNAETGNISAEFVEINDSGDTLDDALEYILENIEANKVDSEDKTVVVTTGDEGTDLSVNIDGKTLVKNGNGVISADLKLIKETEGLEANVKEQYKLVYGDSTTAIGDVVKIYKDSSLIRSYMGHIDDELVSTGSTEVIEGSGDTALCFIYQLADGSYELAAINVEQFLEEVEFEDGFDVKNHVVNLKIDENSEEVVIGPGTGDTAPVLSVGPDGIKVNNIQNAIDYAVEELVGKIDADVTGTSEDGHVTVEVVQENTELKQVVVTTDDIASKEVLDTTIESVGLAEDGSFVSDTAGTYTSAATTVREEIKSIDQALKELSDKFNASSVEEGASIENFVKLDITDDGEGATAVTIDDSELKQTIDFINDDLASETAEREAADAELLGSTASTSAETSIMGLKALIEQLASDLGESAVQDAEFAVLTDAEREAAHCNAGIKVVENGEDGKKIQLDLSLLKIDCGEY